ncbi:sensor histidine kinase [Rhodoferax sp.]|uniref:sensor histidine kinase n=1 Tax=Rhodoferax sp. TaxID=50421 RepID=UPI0008D6F470|nr:sensor histidine kinase [Rhodoferax sp.]MDO8320319.1 sensor histidine kinase [Rhodoferax sp.]MDP2678200.1 sensor histidine kinase [Rhodoferax sp.]OGB53058.1 MAG: histidine kinase [Burkholderiales bacterium RIFOXYD12_FULL_59_19]OGB80646.1 MAG: histidine kinase [Burkholderiales bacterium RIFOXYC12_FULL_60_6]
MANPPQHRGQGLSLKRQLLLWLLLPQLVLFLVGGALAYRIALSYAEKAIDQSLTQSVRSLARQVKPIGSGLLIDFPRAAQDIIEQDPKDRVSYMVSSPPGSFLLGNGKLPGPAQELQLPTHEALLYNAQVDGKPMRVALIEVDYGDSASPQRMRVQVAKSLAVQQRLTTELIADMLAPLLLLGIVLSVLVYGGISRGLQPLTRLQAQLGDRHDQALFDVSPIEMTQAPQEVHALAGAVNHLLAAVRRSLGQEKRFLNDAAHQLRTPLAGLISQTELALAENDPQALRARLSKVLSGAQRSAHLVHQLLSLARNEVEVKLQPLDVAALAREVARDWTPRALKAGIDLGYEGADHLVLVGEAILLREALNNLIDNALTYAGCGSEVTVSVQTQGQQVLLEVADNGPGLSKQDLPHAFERFWRASDVPGGCGLGLAIVAEIAQRHGGLAKVVAAQVQGLRVQLWLPLAQPDGYVSSP